MPSLLALATAACILAGVAADSTQSPTSSSPIESSTTSTITKAPEGLYIECTFACQGGRTSEPIAVYTAYCEALCAPVREGGAMLATVERSEAQSCTEGPASLLPCAAATIDLVCMRQADDPARPLGVCVNRANLRPQVSSRGGRLILSAQDAEFRTELQEPVVTISGVVQSLAANRAAIDEGLKVAANARAVDALAAANARELLSKKVEEGDRALSTEFKEDLDREIGNVRKEITVQTSELKTLILRNKNSIENMIQDTRNKFESLSKELTGLISANTGAIKLVKDTAEQALSSVNNLRSVKVGVQAAGICNGNFIRFFLNGIEKNLLYKTGFSNNRNFLRGINIVKLDLTQNDPNRIFGPRYNFDTCCGSGEISPDRENKRLTKHLQDMPDGQWILAGIHDEGVNNLYHTNKLLLRSFGSKYISGHIRFRESWAMIGCKNCGVGSAIEDHGGYEAPGCGGGGRTTRLLEKNFATGQLSWFNKISTESALQAAIRGTQRFVTFKYDSCRDNWCDSRKFDFIKSKRDSLIKVEWYDNFRCAGGGDRSCRWDVYIDDQMCAKDSSLMTGPIRNDMYNHQNNHYAQMVTGYCYQLANGAYLHEGQHTFRVYERSSPQHNHGSPVLGWNWSNQSPGGNYRTMGGTYTSITITEVY